MIAISPGWWCSCSACRWLGTRTVLFCDSKAFPWLCSTLVKSGVYQRLLVGHHLRRRDSFCCRTWGRRLIPGVLCACSDMEVWLVLKAKQKLVAHTQDSGKHLWSYPVQLEVTGCMSSSTAGPGCSFPGEEWWRRGWDTHGFTGLHWFGTKAPGTTFLSSATRWCRNTPVLGRSSL